jgi:TrpR family trp operon transcriptional repressor
MSSKFEKELIGLIADVAEDRKLLHKFLQDLFTENEMREFSLRWQIILMLAEGYSQREIAKELNVGVATVTRGAKTLKGKRAGFKSVLKYYYQ